MKITLEPTWKDWKIATAAYLAAGGTLTFEHSVPTELAAEITCDHPASSYGIPVIMLPDGTALGIADSPWAGFGMIAVVPNPAPEWRDPENEELVSAAAFAGYQIVREEW